MINQKKTSEQATLPHGWCRTAEAARYAGVDPRYIREWFKSGLRYAEMGKKTKLTKYDYIDDFLNGFHPDDKASVQQIVADVHSKVLGKNTKTGNKGAAQWA